MKDQDLLQHAQALEEADDKDKLGIFKSMMDGLAQKFGITKAAAKDDDDSKDADKEGDEGEDEEDEDEDEEPEVDNEGLDEEYGDDQDEDEDVDVDEGKKKKSFYDHAADDETLAEVMDGEQIIKSMFEAFSKALDAHAERTDRRLVRLEKSLTKRHGEIRKALGTVQDDIDQVGGRPAGGIRPYSIVKALIGGDQERSPETVLAKSLDAVQKKHITGQEARVLELSLQRDEWDNRCETIWKRCNGPALTL